MEILGRGARRDGPPRREWEEERRTERYKEEDKNKPVLQLINPTHVPRGRNYFEVLECFTDKKRFLSSKIQFSRLKNPKLVRKREPLEIFEKLRSFTTGKK